ncbi:MAG: MFS transporter, partial [Stackebrandtia sp.]
MHAVTASASHWTRLLRGPALDEATINRRRWWTLAILNLSLFAIIMDNTILNVALPSLAKDLHASGSDLQWIVDSYVLVFAGLLLSAGALGDRFGRRGALSAGLVVFAAGSVFAMHVDSASMLIAARAVMGVGGALIMPATLSILTNVFTDPKERAKAIGVWAGSVGLAVAIGPIVGGLLLERFWWGSVFLINVPILLAGLIAASILVPESHSRKAGRVDVVGVALSIVGLVALVYGIIEGGENGEWGQIGVWGPILAGAVVLAAFIRYERHTAFPALDVGLFRDPRFSAAVAVVGLVFFAAMGTYFFGAFYLQLARDFSAFEAGLLMLPFAAAQLVFAPLSATLV